MLHKCIFTAALTLMWQLWMQNQKQRGQHISQKKKLSAFSLYLKVLWNVADIQRVWFANIVCATVITPIWNISFPPLSSEKAKLSGVYTNGALILQTLMHVPNVRQHSWPTDFNSTAQMHVWKCLHDYKLILKNAQFIQDPYINNLFLHPSDDFIAVL